MLITSSFFFIFQLLGTHRWPLSSLVCLCLTDYQLNMLNYYLFYLFNLLWP